MAVGILTLMWRALAILSGILIGFFAYEILRLTRGGLKGWLYLAVYGGFLCFWALTALITKVAGITLLERVTGIIGLLGMSVFIPLAFAKMTDELNFRPKWFTARFSVAMSTAVFLILLGLNVTEPSSLAQWLDKLLSVSHFTLGITITVALIPLISLAMNIRRSFWIMTTVATVLMAAAMLVGQHYDGCCGDGGALSDNAELCGQYNLPYAQVTQAPCFAPLVSFGQFYQVYLTVGILILTVSFYRLAKSFRGFEKNA